jgi:two-component system, response regulator PdtaR
METKEPMPGRGKTGARMILVVGDDASAAKGLRPRLESFGYHICEVVNTGREAIASAAQHQPDLVLIDILLEGEMNGIEASEQIRKQLDVPIIYLSALSDRRLLDRAVKIHAYGYLIKPYGNMELRLSIEIALAKHQSAKEREKLLIAVEELRRGEGSNRLLPVCATCKKIRNDEGRWQEIERFIASRAEADFCHGICPECSRRLYLELY